LLQFDPQTLKMNKYSRSEPNYIKFVLTSSTMYTRSCVYWSLQCCS